MYSHAAVLCATALLLGPIGLAGCNTVPKADSGLDSAQVENSQHQGQQDGSSAPSIATTGSLLGDELLLGSNLQTMAVSPNGHRVALGHLDGSLRLVSRTGELLSDTVAYQASITALAFLRDDVLLFGGIDGAIGILKIDANSQVTLQGAAPVSEFPIEVLVPHRETGHLIGIDRNNTLRLWREFSPEAAVAAELPDAWSLGRPTPRFHPRGDRFTRMTRGADLVETYDLEGNLLSTLEPPPIINPPFAPRVCGFHYHESGLLELLVGQCQHGSGPTHIVMNPQSGEVLHRHDLGFAPNESGFSDGVWWFLSQGKLHTLFWDGRRYDRHRVETSPISRLLSESEVHLMVQDERHSVSIIDLRERRTLFEHPPSPLRQPRTLVALDDSSWAISTLRGTMSLGPSEDIRTLSPLPLGAVWSDGKTLIGHGFSDEIDGVFRYDVESQSILWRQPAPEGRVASDLRVSPDARWVIYRTHTNFLVILDAETGEVIRREPHTRFHYFEEANLVGAQSDPDGNESTRISFSLPDGPLQRGELLPAQMLGELRAFQESRIRFLETSTELVLANGEVVELPLSSPKDVTLSPSKRYLLLRPLHISTVIETMPTRVWLYDLKKRTWKAIRLRGTPLESAFSADEDRIFTILSDRGGLSEWSVQEALENGHSF